MNIVDFVTKIKQVEQAVDKNSQNALNRCFCFTGKGVFAFNGIVAAYAPLETPFAGATLAAAILPLSDHKSTDINFEIEGKEIIIKAGKRVITTTYWPAEEFTFAFPDKTDAVAITPDAMFLESMDLALLSASEDSTTPWQLGVTVAFGKNMVMYSTNNIVAGRVIMEKPKDTPDEFGSLILPHKFCSCLAANKKDELASVLFHQDWVEATFKNGLKIWSKTILGANAEEYANVFASVGDKKIREALIPVPDGLERALRNAEVYAEHSTKGFTNFSVVEDRLELTTTGTIGTTEDYVRIQPHAPIKFMAVAKNITKALSQTLSIGFLPNFVMMRSPGFTYLVSTVTE